MVQPTSRVKTVPALTPENKPMERASQPVKKGNAPTPSGSKTIERKESPIGAWGAPIDPASTMPATKSPDKPSVTAKTENPFPPDFNSSTETHHHGVHRMEYSTGIPGRTEIEREFDYNSRGESEVERL